MRGERVMATCHGELPPYLRVRAGNIIARGPTVVACTRRFERSFESQGTGKAKAKAKAKGPLDDDEDEPGSERKRKSFWSALAPEVG